jgi:3-methyladenine DNA glycosylase Mpg
MSDYGASVLRGPICLRSARAGDLPLDVATSRRIGLSQGADLPFRFFAADSPCVGRKSPAQLPDAGAA